MKSIILDDSIILFLNNLSSIEKSDEWNELEQKSYYTILVSEIGQQEIRKLFFDSLEMRDQIWENIKTLVGM